MYVNDITSSYPGQEYLLWVTLAAVLCLIAFLILLIRQRKKVQLSLAQAIEAHEKEVSSLQMEVRGYQSQLDFHGKDSASIKDQNRLLAELLKLIGMERIESYLWKQGEKTYFIQIPNTNGVYVWKRSEAS